MRAAVPFCKHQTTSFPLDDYTPYGYLATPAHTGLHPSGVVRSAPPLGFGIWTRGLPWYGMDSIKAVNNYVCLALPAIQVDDLLLAEREDFQRAGVTMVSRYHSANIMSYDFEARGVRCSLAWFLMDEDALCLKARFVCGAQESCDLGLSIGLVYGMNGRGWWGSDAVTMRYWEDAGALISKILAYGDVFCLTADAQPRQGVTARDEDELAAWRRGERALTGAPHSTRLPRPGVGAIELKTRLAAGEEWELFVVLARGVSEKCALAHAREALEGADGALRAKLEEDNAFYQGMPLLAGDWPDAWRRGWIYDFETLRMNLRPARGIYRHTWDAMQALNPRVVLGETAIDMLTLGYADLKTAMEVMEGIFEDAPEPYVPCTREDGSMNMIGSDGSECATAPIWGMPMRAIRILVARSGDLAWLERMYPRLQAYLAWWEEHRTDREGWYHCNNSWESGQDGSSRFPVDQQEENGPFEGANAEHVRTADLEAAMAAAMADMAAFARLLGREQDAAEWTRKAQRGAERTRSMFVEKCFRDFDARSGQPYLVEERYDIMLTMPVALGLATPQQKERIRWLFELYASQSHQKVETGYAPFWPPILQTLIEAMHQMGDGRMTANLFFDVVDPAWRRNDRREPWPMEPLPGVEARHSLRIPGNGRENLAVDLKISGCENYGWGCLAPMLLIENIVGLRPVDALGHAFELTPALPNGLDGERFEVRNLSHGAFRFDLKLTRRPGGILCEVSFRSLPEGARAAGQCITQGQIQRLLAPGEALRIEI